MSTTRTTNQKTIILKYLQNIYSHPTAEEIFINVRQKIPRISRATVYRNLENFIQQGIIKEIPGNKKRFDANTSEHHHFICDKCEQIYDLFFVINLTNKDYKKIKKQGKIKNYQLLCHGICQKCLQK